MLVKVHQTKCESNISLEIRLENAGAFPSPQLCVKPPKINVEMSEDRSYKTTHGQNDNNGLLQFFCRHLVSLCFTFQKLDDKNRTISEIIFDAFPGVIINIRGIFHFLTAGHILQDLDDALRKEKVIIHSSVLADTFGPGATSPQPIPFDFLNEPKFYIDNEEDGLDFGLIMLRPYYVRLLEKHGIIAIFEKNWIYQDRLEFHRYAMLGLPEEFISAIQSGSDQNLQTLGSVSPTLISLQKPAVQPENIKKTKYSRFVGQLNSDIPLKSIAGMSGGPIFGFNLNPPVRYWIVAIQSRWLKTRGITFGCPLPVLANLLTEWTDELLKAKPEY